MPENKRPRAMGWKPDKPDDRDVTVDSPEIVNLLIQSQLDEPISIDGDVTADLREWFSPVEDQGNLRSCSAHAGVALIEYFQRRVLGNHRDVSRLFLYKMTRELLKWSGDSGATLRFTMKAISRFGVPPEEIWPYQETVFDDDPPASSKAYSQDYKNIRYYRLDAPGHSRNDLRIQICSNLVFGQPCVFGFNVYSSIDQAEQTGMIPYPSARRDPYRDAHAVVAVGFDRNLEITNAINNRTTKGAFLIRNSWGADWGDRGYGWLPFKYVTSPYKLTQDWWSVINTDWIQKGKFLADRKPSTSQTQQA